MAQDARLRGLSASGKMLRVQCFYFFSPIFFILYFLYFTHFLLLFPLPAYASRQFLLVSLLYDTLILFGFLLLSPPLFSKTSISMHCAIVRYRSLYSASPDHRILIPVLFEHKQCRTQQVGCQNQNLEASCSMGNHGILENI